jgi:hypothetical protein
MQNLYGFCGKLPVFVPGFDFLGVAANDVSAALSTTNTAKQVSYSFTPFSPTRSDDKVLNGVQAQKNWLSAWLAAKRSKDEASGSWCPKFAK